MTAEFVEQLQAVLDSLSPESFYELSTKALDLLVNNSQSTENKFLVVTELILTKAANDPNLSSTLVRLIQFVSQHYRQDEDLDVAADEIIRKIFPEMWKKEFLKTIRDEEINESPESGGISANMKQRLEENRWKCRMKVLGTARVAGEMFKLGFVQQGVIWECIEKCLGAKTEESYEFLYDILMNSGEALERKLKGNPFNQCGDDKPKNVQIEELFEALRGLSFDTVGVSLRARIALCDLIEHREQYWNIRKFEPSSTHDSQVIATTNQSVMGKAKEEFQSLIQQISKPFYDHGGVNIPRNKPIRCYHRDELLRIGKKMKGKKLRINLPHSDIIKAPLPLRRPAHSSGISTESISPRPMENYCNKRSRTGKVKTHGSHLSLNKLGDRTGDKAKSDRVSMWLLLARTKRISEN